MGSVSQSRASGHWLARRPGLGAPAPRPLWHDAGVMAVAAAGWVHTRTGLWATHGEHGSAAEPRACGSLALEEQACARLHKHSCEVGTRSHVCPSCLPSPSPSPSPCRSWEQPGDRGALGGQRPAGWPLGVTCGRLVAGVVWAPAWCHRMVVVLYQCEVGGGARPGQRPWAPGLCLPPASAGGDKAPDTSACVVMTEAGSLFSLLPLSLWFPPPATPVVLRG